MRQCKTQQNLTQSKIQNTTKLKTLYNTKKNKTNTKQNTKKHITAKHKANKTQNAAMHMQSFNITFDLRL